MNNLLWYIIQYFTVSVFAAGLSKQKPVFERRVYDSPLPDPPCKEPPFTLQLPPDLSREIHAIWELYDGSGNCSEEISKTRNVLAQLSPAKRAQIRRKWKQCKPPEVINSFPEGLRERIIKIWNERDPNGNCWEQQKKTRLILLNLPPSLRRALHPPALECSLPHFIDRLEWDLQVQLRRLWAGYKRGEPCSKYVAKQLRLLQQHDISLESFDMPPARMFRRYELIQKLKRSNTA
ncbi:hypothetical protein RB195_000378 [Necator americanus]